MPTSLFYYMNGNCFKQKKNCCQACPTSILMRFSQGSIPESLMGKKITIEKVIQRLLKETTATI